MTLTTEQLRARAKIWRKKSADAKWQSVRIAQDMLHNADAFDELAANREAQPVAWRYRTTDINGNTNPNWSFSEEASLLGLYQPLYTAPPAPAVPEAISTRQAIIKMESHEPCDSTNVAYKLGWNACRAAMLGGEK